MDKQDWVRRYKQEFINTAHLSDEEAQSCVDASTFEEVSAHFEEDPEGAAQEEMSYWD
jgi:hypothetical protein